MLWRVRTTLDDRPGALAKLATRCGAADVNIVGLQIFPTMAGVVDELILHPPADWDAEAVADLIERSGGRDVAVVSCTAHCLQDPPTRYLRAATRLLDAPGDLVPALERLFECGDGPSSAASGPPSSGSSSGGSHVLRLGGGGDTVLRREWAAFTDAERARAGALADLVDRVRTVRAAREGIAEHEPPFAGSSPGAGAAPPAGRPTVRVAAPGDIDAVHRFHTRCSFQTLLHGYPGLLVADIANSDSTLARHVTAPRNGVSLLAQVGQITVGTATLVASSERGRYELGLLVEDSWQRRGIGSVLLGNAATVAAARGGDVLVLRTGHDNGAVLPTIDRAGLRARVRGQDHNLVEIVVPLARRGALRLLPGGRRGRGAHAS